MKNNLQTNIGLALLRIAPSIMLLTHGIPKFQKLISGNFEFGDPIGIGTTPSLFLAVIGEFDPARTPPNFRARLRTVSRFTGS